MHGKYEIKGKLRVIICFLAVFFAAMCQMSVFPYLKFFGCIPDITAASVICLAAYENEKTVCVLSVCAGFLLQSLGMEGVSYYPLLFLFAAALCLFFTRDLFHNRFVAVLCTAFCVYTIESIASVIILSGKASYADIFTAVVLPQFVYSFVCTLAVYPLCKLHGAVFGIKRKSDYYEE